MSPGDVRISQVTTQSKVGLIFVRVQACWVGGVWDAIGYGPDVDEAIDAALVKLVSVYMRYHDEDQGRA